MEGTSGQEFCCLPLGAIHLPPPPKTRSLELDCRHHGTDSNDLDGLREAESKRARATRYWLGPLSGQLVCKTRQHRNDGLVRAQKTVPGLEPLAA